eukprot:scaffold329_cov174-Pinguiococcus_pyrenoidosus.AAC.2
MMTIGSAAVAQDDLSAAANRPRADQKEAKVALRPERRGFRACGQEHRRRPPSHVYRHHHRIGRGSAAIVCASFRPAQDALSAEGALQRGDGARVRRGVLDEALV